MSRRTNPIKTFYQFFFLFFLQSLEEGNSKQSYFWPKIVFLVSLFHSIFFLVYSIYAFRGKQPRNLPLNCCVFLYVPYTHYLAFNVLKKAEGYFFLYYDPNVTIKKCSSTFDTHVLIENLLLIVPCNIYGIALLVLQHCQSCLLPSRIPKQ